MSSSRRSTARLSKPPVSLGCSRSRNVFFSVLPLSQKSREAGGGSVLPTVYATARIHYAHRRRGSVAARRARSRHRSLSSAFSIFDHLRRPRAARADFAKGLRETG